MSTNKRCCMVGGTCLIFTLALLTVAGVALSDAAELSLSPSYSFVVVEIPDSDGQLGSTAATDINDEGKLLAGITAGPRGFLVDKFELTEIQCPAGGPTAARSINRRGDITGWCSNVAGLVGFLRGEDGKYTLLNYSHAILTEAVGLNDDVQVVGDYRDSTGRFHGFVWDSGLFLTIDVPFPGAQDSAASGVNNVGQIVGFYRGSDSYFHGYLYDGTFTSIDFPEAIETELVDINDQGQILGSYADSAGSGHSFLLDNGAFMTIDAPFPGVLFTQASGLNNRGQIVGRFLDNVLRNRAFVATPGRDSIAVSRAPAQPTVTRDIEVTSKAGFTQTPAAVRSTIGQLPRASRIESGR